MPVAPRNSMPSAVLATSSWAKSVATRSIPPGWARMGPSGLGASGPPITRAARTAIAARPPTAPRGGRGGAAERSRGGRRAAYSPAKGECGQHDADADEEDDRIEARNVSQRAAESGVVVDGVGGEGQRKDRRADQAFGDGHSHNPSILSIQCISYTPYK